MITARPLSFHSRDRDAVRNPVSMALAWILGVVLIASAQIVLDVASGSIFEATAAEMMARATPPVLVARAVERGAQRDLLVFER
jgi:hypothetical protein